MPNNPTLKKRRPGQHLTDEERAITQAKFLAAYAKTANVSLACRSAKIDRSTFYEWKNDETFAKELAFAEEDANDVVEAEIFRRAVKGVVEPVVNSGGLVYEWEPVLDPMTGMPKVDADGKPKYRRGKQITITKYSDTLLIFHAKKRIPGYREKQQVEISGAGGGPLAVMLTRLSDDELAALETMAQKATGDES